jgi:hypothetical protein
MKLKPAWSLAPFLTVSGFLMAEALAHRDWVAGRENELKTGVLEGTDVRRRCAFPDPSRLTICGRQ